MTGRAKILVLYDAYSTFTQTVIEHLRSFAMFSAHDIVYAHAVRAAAPIVPLEHFDGVVIHYSVRLCVEDWISPPYAAAVAAYPGPKFLFIQDEYDNTETARRWFERLGFSVVFTCVPEESVEAVYPKSRFAGTRFVTVLTGYVPPRFEGGTPRRPIRDRAPVIAYRGRPLAPWYGQLGREKLLIGQQMKKLCTDRGIACDIEWTEEARVYGERWYDFLGSAKATLGTESGANIFDDHGDIRRSVKAAQRANPGITFEEIFEKFLLPFEGKVKMNQISPKVFEAIGLGTVLVLYEGEYSGVLQPWKHYIPLKKDLSNAEEVFRALSDDGLLQEIADRAYAEVIGSGRWSYARAVAEFDENFSRSRGAAPAQQPFFVVLGSEEKEAGGVTPARIGARARMGSMMTSAPLRPGQVRLAPGYVPLPLRIARSLWDLSGLASIVDRIRVRNS